MILESPAAGLLPYRRRWLRDRLRSRLKQGGCHVYGRGVSQISTRLPPVGREGSDRRKQFLSLAHDWTQAALLMEEDLKRS